MDNPPYAELEDNNTHASVSDLEKLREHFGIEKWHVFGGSWGSTLSLIYAQNHPSRVLSLTLEEFSCVEKVSCTGFTKMGSHVFPDAFEPYRPHSDEEQAI